jgi:chemotaxis protein methyltransferase CheR
MGCSDSDYVYLRGSVHSGPAILVEPSRNGLFETRLKPIVRRAGASNLEEIVSILRADQSPHLHRAVAAAMTINETSFFRDCKAFDELRKTILPRLIEANSAERKLRIWSAAASNGQEAYSVAMLICEHFPNLASWDVKIIGTDISRQVVEYARNGVYRRLEVNRGLPARMLVKYLVRDGDEWEVVPKLRSMCDFQHANLCGQLPQLPIFDLVLLRNVLLYLTPKNRSSVFAVVRSQMAQTSCLLLGASEQAEDSTKLFEAEFTGECYFYRPIVRS